MVPRLSASPLLPGSLLQSCLHHVLFLALSFPFGVADPSEKWMILSCPRTNLYRDQEARCPGAALRPQLFPLCFITAISLLALLVAWATDVPSSLQTQLKLPLSCLVSPPRVEPWTLITALPCPISLVTTVAIHRSESPVHPAHTGWMHFSQDAFMWLLVPKAGEMGASSGPGPGIT